MQDPSFTFADIKYADDPAMFARAEALLKSGRVGEIEEIGFGKRYGYRAVVQGTRPYKTWVSGRRVDEGDCTCPMGEREMLCKHMLALALAALAQTGLLADELPSADLAEAKRRVSVGMKKLRAYDGPSQVWWSYQRRLSTGAGMISEAVQGLSASKKHAEYLWALVLRLSDKLATGGIDDSDGTVGNCVMEVVAQLAGYAKEMPELKPALLAHCNDDTGFGFEDDLRKRLHI